MRLAGAFGLSDSVVAVVGAERGEFLDVNPAFERAFGYRRGDVIGRLPLELDFWPDFEARAHIWAQLRAARRVVGLPVRMRAADGRLLLGSLDCELFSDGEDVRVLCLLQDVREQGAEAAPVPEYDAYRSLYFHAAEGIYRSLPGGGFIDVNPAMARIFGYASPAQMLKEVSRDASRLYADREQAAELYRRLRLDGHFEGLHCRAYRRDGSLIWISENSRVIADADGRPLFYEGSVTDITAQVDAENALRQSETLYKVLIDNSRDGVFLIQRGRVVFANQAMAAMLGYAPDELAGMDYMDLVDPADRDAQAVRRGEREGGSHAPQHYEITLRRRDGSAFLCEVRADAVEYEGDIASTGTIRDVTEERRHQRALVEAERRYRELFEDSPVGLFRTHIDGSILEVNPVMARMLGYASPAELKASVRHMAELYADPEERPVLVREVLEDGGFSDHEMQVNVKGGGRIWVNASVRLIRPEDGGEPHFAGSVQDITQRRAMEEAVQRSESKYRTLVEHSQVGVFISRGDRYTYVNHTYAAMLGYSEDELCRIPFRELVAPEYLSLAEERIRRIEQGLPLPPDFESCYLRKDGSRVYVTVSVGSMEVDGEPHMTGTVRDISRHREVEQRLRFHATHDPLTGLPNRMVFQQRLSEVLRQAHHDGGHHYAVLFLDLDGFKWVNDSLGHGSGDRLLVEIARKLAAALDGDTLLARYGGDEFTLLPEGPCGRERAVAIAERVIGVFEQPFDIGGQAVFSAASLGIVLGRSEYEAPDQILRDADTAMYRAKATGKSGYVIFDEAMHNEARARFQLETDFRLAFERAEFRVYYQPVVALASGGIVGCEALVRWQHPTRGLLAPGAFLPIAEETGLIADLDSWVLARACRQVAGWRTQHRAFAGLTLNVNIDERQLSGHELLHEVAAAVYEHGLEPASLRLEVTETVFRAGRGHAEQRLRELKALGVGLVVDDFGTGYSSLDSFAASPFDALKIDRSFIRDMESNPRHRAIVRTITAFAEDLGLSLTAEGIESPGQRRLLSELGCQLGQGHLFAEALDPEAFSALLARGEALAA